MLTDKIIKDFDAIGISENRIDGCTIQIAGSSYRKKARTLHPDKVGPDHPDTTAAFQLLGNAYRAVLEYLVEILKDVKEECMDDEAKFARDNFESFNFPHENKGRFTVEIQHHLADTWQDCLEKKFGSPRVFTNSNGT